MILRPGEVARGEVVRYELDLPAEEWLPGTYQVIFFVGTDWKVVGEFRVTGEPPLLLPAHSQA